MADETLREFKDVAGISARIEEEETKRYRRLSGFAKALASVIAITLPIYSFLYIIDVFTPLGLLIYSGSYCSIFLAAVMALVFLLVPAVPSSKGRVPWYDWVCIVISCIGLFYVAVNYEDIISKGGAEITSFQVLLGVLTIVTLFEAVRRTLGWPMIIIAVLFLIHAKFTHLFPGILHGPEFSLARLMNYLYLSDQGIFGLALSVSATMIITFMIFGGFLGVSGIGEIFMKMSVALMGHVRGGAGKVAIVASALLGMLTGSPMAEIGVVGSMTIPLMKRIGYKPVFAAAVEAAAACGGVIDPPIMGTVAFLIADFTRIEYGQIALAAIIPAILYYLSIFFQLDLRAAVTNLKGLPREELPNFKEVVRGNWVLFLPLGVLIFLMMVLQYEPMRATYIATGLLILIVLLRRRNRLTWSKFAKALEMASTSMIEVTPITAVAGIIMGCITLTGFGLRLSSLLVTVSGGNLLFLGILAAVAIYIMGMGVSAITTYILMAVLVAPAMTQLGVPTIVAHFFIFYISVSMFITPPYAPAAYMAATVAGADPLRVGYQAMRLAIVAYLVPFISLFQPALLGVGTPLEIAIAAITAVMAVYALSVAFEGYCLCRLTWTERILWLAAGFLLFVPNTTLAVPGTLLFLCGLVIQWVRRNRGVPHDSTLTAEYPGLPHH